MANILLVDDDEFVREGLRAVLEANDHVVTAADSLAAARACLADASAATDLILLDVWLGADYGLELLQERADAEEPIIVMSAGGPGRSLEQVIAVADSFGAAAVLLKPFQNDELLRTIDAALG